MKSKTDDIVKTQRETLAVFQRVNPTRRDFSPGDPRLADLRKREETIYNNLGFPSVDFREKRILEAGCGTGDIALMLADWGATVDAFDLNEHSVAHAQSMAKRFPNSNRCRFQQGSVFSPPYNGQYDFVQCLGVLAHVGDPKLAFKTLASRVKPGGFLYIMNLNTWGFLSRWLKRAIVSALALGNPERKARWAQRLWKKHISRAAKFGVRTEEQIAWDNFVAPHKTETIGEWLEWMKECDMEYVSSYPSFYSLKLPSTSTGGIEPMPCQNAPRNLILRWLLRGLVQIRWAMALGVGGLCSISFVARKRPAKNP